MDTPRLAITKRGSVYRLQRHVGPVLLGHISCLAQEESPLGREVSAWWQARVASDEPSENIEVTGSNFRFVPSAERVVVIGSQPEPHYESAESEIAAD
jgi:hypothetical protein